MEIRFGKFLRLVFAYRTRAPCSERKPFVRRERRRLRVPGRGVAGIRVIDPDSKLDRRIRIDENRQGFSTSHGRIPVVMFNFPVSGD